MEFCSTRANTKTSINKVHGIPYQIYKQKVKKTVSVAIEKKMLTWQEFRKCCLLNHGSLFHFKHHCQLLLLNPGDRFTIFYLVLCKNYYNGDKRWLALRLIEVLRKHCFKKSKTLTKTWQTQEKELVDCTEVL